MWNIYLISNLVKLTSSLTKSKEAKAQVYLKPVDCLGMCGEKHQQTTWGHHFSLHNLMVLMKIK